MNDFANKTAAVVDSTGLFFNVAQTLAQSFGRTLYHTPQDEEFPSVLQAFTGTGFPGVERMDDIWRNPEFDAVDLWVFPGLGYVGAQEHLRALGKRVFGAGAAGEIEAQRVRFLKLLEKHGLDVPPYEVVEGVTALREHLKKRKNVWIKLPRWRRDRETSHWRSYDEDFPLLDYFATRFGPFKEMVAFIVQDHIETDLELGCDLICVDGMTPTHAVNGMEKKDKMYLGVCLPWEEIPEQVRTVVETFSPELEGYRGFLSTEQRIAGDKNYWTDFTGRLGFPSGNCQLRLYGNIADVMWGAAEGEVVPIEPAGKYAIEVLIDSTAKGSEWSGIKIPEDAWPYVNPNSQCVVDDILWHPPLPDTNEATKTLGSFTVTGNTIKEAVAEAQRVADMLKDLPINLHMGGIKDLLEEAQEAEEQGIPFSDEPTPDPKEVLKDE